MLQARPCLSVSLPISRDIPFAYLSRVVIFLQVSPDHGERRDVAAQVQPRQCDTNDTREDVQNTEDRVLEQIHG